MLDECIGLGPRFPEALQTAGLRASPTRARPRRGFGSEDYAREESLIELASLFIGTMRRLRTDILNHASYLGSWIAALKQDQWEILRVAADAQRAADDCLAFPSGLCPDPGGRE